MRIKEYSLVDNPESGGIRSYHVIREPSRREYSGHHHTECEISLFLKGEGTYTVGRRSYDFSAGDVFFFVSDEEHSITEIRQEIELLNIQFEPYILWETPDAADLTALFNARNPSFESRFSDADGSIGRELLLIEKELSEKKPCYFISVRCHLFSALTTLIRDYSYVDYRGALRTSDAVKQSVKASIDYILRNLERDLTLKSIAEIACLSPNYFSYIFKKYNGISLWQYINIKRVEKAIKMLKSEDLTKLEIAQRCGFSSPSNFYKIFSAVTGKTPSDYTRRA